VTVLEPVEQNISKGHEYFIIKQNGSGFEVLDNIPLAKNDFKMEDKFMYYALLNPESNIIVTTAICRLKFSDKEKVSV
jgi:hypothetical protein